MNVGDAAQRLAGQARRVEVVDVARRRVQEIERVEHDVRAGRQVIAELSVEQTSWPGSDAAVFDERPRPEISQPKASEEPARSVGGQTEGHHGLRGAGDQVPGRIL